MKFIYYTGNLALELTKWALAIAVIGIYNIFSLVVGRLEYGLAIDIVVISLVVFILAFDFKNRTLTLNYISLYAVALNITLAIFIDPLLSKLLKSNELISTLNFSYETLNIIDFILKASIFITMHFVLEKSISSYGKIKMIAKFYSIAIILLISFLILNYRIHIYLDLNFLPKYYDLGKYIMTESVIWVIDNV